MGFAAGFCSAPNQLHTDGTNVLAADFCSSGESLVLVAGGQADALWTGTESNPPPVNGQTNNGWMAFARPTLVGGSLEVWRRSPTGVTDQLTFTSADSIVDTLAEDGTVVAASDATSAGAQQPAGGFIAVSRFIASSTAPPVPMPVAGKLLWLNGGWYMILGRYVFAVDAGGGAPDGGVTLGDAGADAGSGVEAGVGGVDASVGTGDGGVDSGADGEGADTSSPFDASAFEASGADGGSMSDSAASAGEGTAPAGAGSHGGGGGCNASGTSSRASPIIGLAVGLLLIRRRRRPSSS
jgi:hypothetical protein